MTKRTKKIFKAKNIFFLSFGLILVLSYTINPFKINNQDLFHGFERQPEGLVVGRLVKAETDGIMSGGGLTGINYHTGDSLSEKHYTEYQSMQHDLYIKGNKKPDSFYAYKSQSGGQAILMATIAKVLPVQNIHKLAIFRLFNAILIAIIFLLLAAWVSRNFGFIASVILLICLLFTPWINIYAHSLWWVLWSFYLPFITVLLVCESNYNKKKSLITLPLLIFTLLSVVLKCWFTGFEFITTSLLAGFVPFIYYSYLNRTPFIRFIVSSFILGLVMLIGVFLEGFILTLQIEAYTGISGSGLEHIIHSFTKRTATELASLGDVLLIYFKNDFLHLGFLSNHYSFYFGGFFVIALLLSIYLYLEPKNNRATKALIITFFCSFVAPLSWLIIFKQHAFIHQHMDYIVWYMPTILYGYIIIGIGVQKIFSFISPISKIKET